MFQGICSTFCEIDLTTQNDLTKYKFVVKKVSQRTILSAHTHFTNTQTQTHIDVLAIIIPDNEKILGHKYLLLRAGIGGGTGGETTGESASFLLEHTHRHKHI